MTYMEGNGIFLVLKGPSKVSIASYLSLGDGKSFFLLVLVLIRLDSSSSEDGVKYLASSFTLLGPILCLGSSGMSCNLSLVCGVAMLRGTVLVAFPASTLLLDPVSLRRLRGYGGSGCEAMGGADTGLGRCCCSMALCITRIHCFAPSRMLLVTACPSLSRSWLRRDPRDLSTSRISGDVDTELLVLPVLGLVEVEEASLLDVPLELSEELLLLSLAVFVPASEGSFMVVSLELGCCDAGREAL